MTNPNSDNEYGGQSHRLDRIEALVESNARAIQAMGSQVAEAAEERQQLREAILRITVLTEGIANLVTSLDEERPTILGRLSRIENKVDQLLQRKNDNNAGS